MLNLNHAELDVNMFLMEYAAAAKELKELEEKNIIAQNQLKDTQSSYDRTKVEYERLEQELEDLPRWQRSPC
mgnify:FL=1